MRITFLSAFAVSAVALLAACSGEAPTPQPPGEAGAAQPATAQEALSGPVEAERAFAADAARIGWIDAYPLWAAQDGVVLQNGVSSALEFAANIHPQVRGDTSLAWGPEFAGVSAAGDFGFTAGPFNGDGAAFGYYLTVWRKQADGSWKWLFEGGVDTPDPTVVPGADAVVASVTPASVDGTGATALAAVAAEETKLARQVAAEGGAALGEYLNASVRVHRENAAPATDLAAAQVLVARDPAGINYAAPLRTETASSGDMAFTVGTVSWTGGAGHYTRIWMLTGAGWRLVFDQIVPE